MTSPDPKTTTATTATTATAATTAAPRSSNRIAKIEIDGTGMAAPTPEIEQERKVAIFDLLEENSFAPVPRGDAVVPEGPYALNLSIRDKRLVVEIATAPGDDQAGATAGETAGEKAGEFHLSLGPFRQVVKDYYAICESYFDAVKNMPPAQIETIDMARRGIHGEGARVVQERLEGKADIDEATARRLFTLICVLHWG